MREPGMVPSPGLVPFFGYYGFLNPVLAAVADGVQLGNGDD